jgi:hypothetical protein
MATQEEVMSALVGKLYAALTTGDGTAEPDPDDFIAWCTPGLGFQPENLEFATKGLEGATGAETRSLLAQASDFAKLVNLVPDPSGIYNEAQQQTTFDQSGSILWNTYSNALNFSEVASSPLTPAEKAQLEKFSKLLRTTRTNLVTGAEEAVDGPVLVAYNDKRRKYISAALAYNLKRIAAINADNPAVVSDWALNAPLYELDVQNARDDWATNGYRNEVNDMRGFIDQVTRRDLTLLKASLLNQLELAKQRDLVSGSDFFFTSFVPGDFAASTDGWTEFTFSESNYSTYSSYKTNSWSAGGSAGWGPWSARVKASGSSSSTNSSVDVGNFNMSFWFTQVPISRPWFSPEFLTSRAWRFRSGLGMSPLSDGAQPPTGQLVAYPTTAIFIRDVLIDFNELHNSASTYTSQISAGGGVSYGPFSLGGSYSRSSGNQRFNSTMTAQGLKVEGMQLIGFKCAILPVSPNPDPAITDWE